MAGIGSRAYQVLGSREWIVTSQSAGCQGWGMPGKSSKASMNAFVPVLTIDAAPDDELAHAIRPTRSSALRKVITTRAYVLLIQADLMIYVRGIEYVRIGLGSAGREMSNTRNSLAMPVYKSARVASIAFTHPKFANIARMVGFSLSCTS